jgi:hypothetical protein
MDHAVEHAQGAAACGGPVGEDLGDDRDRGLLRGGGAEADGRVQASEGVGVGVEAVVVAEQTDHSALVDHGALEIFGRPFDGERGTREPRRGREQLPRITHRHLVAEHLRGVAQNGGVFMAPTMVMRAGGVRESRERASQRSVR